MREDGVRVVNIMADGSVCEDLSQYLGPEHQLPDNVKALILDVVREGYEILAKRV